MQKEKTRAWYKKNHADVWFSRFIRLRDRGHCYTCPHVNENPMKLQCGHFVPRQYLATRYNEMNNHAQCYACNMLFGGQPSAYAIRLKNEYGDYILSDLESQRKEIVHDLDYKKIGDKYKLAYELLLAQGNEL